MTKSWMSLVPCAALALWAVACGQPAPSGPTRVPVEQAIGSFPAISQPSLGPLTTSWECFSGDSGIFPQAKCGRSVTWGAQSLGAVAAAGTPSTPTGLASSVSGTTVTLTWSYISGSNPDASSFIVEAGSSSGLSNLTSFDTGSSAKSLTVTQVPAGTYFVRVRGRTFDGVTGPVSNEVILTVAGSVPTACTSAPGAPTGLNGATNGSEVNLAWSAPAGACAATSYVLEAGSAAGLSDLASFNTGSTATQYAASGVAAGTYYVRVRAANAVGNSAASNEVIVTVGGSTPTGVSGTWIGLVANGDGTTLNSSDCGLEKSDWQLDLVQSGNTVTGTLTQTTRVSGCDPAGLVKSIGVVGTVSGATFSFNLVNQPSRNGTATFTATRMTGSTGFAGTFALNRQ